MKTQNTSCEVVEGCARTLGRPTGLPSANLPSETQAFLRRIYVNEGCFVDDEETVVEPCQCEIVEL